MGSTNRAAAERLRLLAELKAHPYRFDFYQALRRLEALRRDLPRIGRSLHAAEDPVRLVHAASLAFAPASLVSFDDGQQGRTPRLSVAFGGLLGPNGPLPLHLTEYARDRLRNAGDPTLVRFLDIFHHRMLSLLYRAWADAQPTVQFDRPESDRFAAYVGSLAGIGLPSLKERDAMPDLAKLYFAGRLVCHTRNAEGLQAMLGEFFRLPMRLIEFVGQWLTLPDDCRCSLGGGQSGGSGTAQLGVSATIGDKVWDCQSRFRIVAGPMGLADYQRLLPGGESLERLMALVRNYVGLELDWELHLLLDRGQVPPTQLGSMGQLGWTTWLISKPPESDAADLVLQPA